MAAREYSVREESRSRDPHPSLHSPVGSSDISAWARQRPEQPPLILAHGSNCTKRKGSGRCCAIMPLFDFTTVAWPGSPFVLLAHLGDRGQIGSPFLIPMLLSLHPRCIHCHDLSMCLLFLSGWHILSVQRVNTRNKGGRVSHSSSICLTSHHTSWLVFCHLDTS